MRADVEQALRIGSIEITERGLAERTREGHCLVFVPRSEIERVTLVHGFTSERSIATLLGALLCFGGAIAMAWPSVASLYRGEGFVVIGPLVMLGLIGGSLLRTLLRRGRYLRVDTTRGVRKLIFDGARDDSSVYEALGAASSRWGYVVELASREEK
jgi:hypothetical protein